MTRASGELPNPSEHAAELERLLEEWSLHYEKDDAFVADCASRPLERRIVELAECGSGSTGLPAGTEWLYRGQGIGDDLMLRLLDGAEVEVEPTHRLFVSWSTRLDVAERFATDAAEGCLASSVVLRIRCERLPILCVLPANLGNREDEVLVRNGALRISMDDVVRAWTYDDDEVATSEVDMEAWRGRHGQATPRP